MKGSKIRSSWVGTALLAVALCFAKVIQPQQTREAIPPGPEMHITTQERLETEPWWPTMATSPLKAYAGSSACSSCHAEQVSATATGMQRAATRPTLAAFQPQTAHSFFSANAMTYAMTVDKEALQLSAASHGRKATQSVDWVVGAGDLARTFLYIADGRWYQSEASYYTRLAALDITTGFGASTSTSPIMALGNLLSPAEARSCFNCHTVHATTSAGLQPLHAEGGIGCEACHGPGQQHVEAMTAKPASNSAAASKIDDATIFFPGKLSPSDSIDFCGACHRSYADASLSTGPQADRAVVRFQPYRLEESKCWRTTMDERLTCVACHDPHKPLVRDAASYDTNCLQCHAGAAKPSGTAHPAAVCPKATRECVTCHMPKVEIPSMHGAFTDHFIRIAKVDEPLPR